MGNTPPPVAIPGPPTAPPDLTPRQAVAVATDPARPEGERVAAFAVVPDALMVGEDDLDRVFGVLGNRADPVAVRLAALQALQTASFGSPYLRANEADYRAALRGLLDDPDPTLRRRALGELARAKDGPAQQRLIAGLQDPSRALVEPEKALQMLSYDVHAGAYPVARAVVANPPSVAAKREALRLLAGDANSAGLLARVFRDKAEPAEVRQVCAAALHALRPDLLLHHAREILLDAGEHGDILATSLAALTRAAPPGVGADARLRTRAAELAAAAVDHVRQSARDFLDKFK